MAFVTPFEARTECMRMRDVITKSGSSQMALDPDGITSWRGAHKGTT
jgi:hypothetical protein